jgi:hypothetical protein
MNAPPRRSLALLLLLGSLVPAAPVRAQLYRWTDDGGEVHFTQGLASVPERVRGRAVIVGYPEQPGPAPAPPAAAAPATPGPRPPAPGPGLAEGVLARIPFVPGAPILVTVRINGGRSLRLLLDTGASRTTISPRALSALGIEVGRGAPVRLRGVTGSAEAVTAMLESLEVGEARVGPLEVVAHDANLLQGDGLLGRDFLDRFQLSIDTAARVVQIGRR